MTNAFSSDECNVLAQALDTAWDIISHSQRIESANIQTTKAALTRAILASYDSGEHNPRRLAIAAVAQVDAPRSRVAAASSVSPAA